MKILLLGDRESPFLWDYYRPGVLADYELILASGDLDPNYLSFIVTMARCPVLYVHGNHDGIYEKHPPEGCDCIEDKIVSIKGLRIAGLGGCLEYSGGAHQYSERHMARRVRRLGRKIKRLGGVDIILTHSPPAGYGDADDRAHRGFRCFTEMMEEFSPRFFVHSHVHLNYGHGIPRIIEKGKTTIINAYERHDLEI